MALPTNNSRPNLPYLPEQTLPNSNRYQALGNFPPKAEQIDADLNAAFDVLNDLAQAINETAAGTFPGSNDPLNANKLATTDGQGNVSWTLINSNNLNANAVDTRHYKDRSVTSSKIQLGAVGSDLLGAQSVQNIHMGLGAVLGSNVADHALSLDKLVLSSESSVVVGSNGGPYYAAAMNPWELVTVTDPSAGPVGQSLSTIWQNTNANFDGRKIEPQSLDQSKIALKTLSRDQMADQTITANQIAPGAMTPSLIAPKSLGDDQMTDSGMTGRVLADSSVPLSKLMDSQYIAPFAMAFGNTGGLINGFNIQSMSGDASGVYSLLFQREALSANYIVQVTPRLASDETVAISASVINTTSTGFTIKMQPALGQGLYRPFYVIVYDF